MDRRPAELREHGPATDKNKVMGKSTWFRTIAARHRVASGLLILVVFPFALIVVSGNEHVRDNHKLWVEVAAWISAGAIFALLATLTVIYCRWTIGRLRH
jgi:hypothetical protein